MNDEEIKLRRRQELASANDARKALDAGNPTRAISLIEQASEFWPQNSIIILSVIGFDSDNLPLVKRAHALFHKQLGLCSNPNALPQIALWLRNPKRARSIPSQLKVAIDDRRKMLEPDWDGIWIDHGTGPSNKALAILKKRPEEISEPDDCLIAAGQTRNWDPWIKRYHSLGGSRNDPVYLKLMVAKAVPLCNKPSWHTKGLLKKFTAIGPIPEVRSFLRHITPVHMGADGMSPNEELAGYALFLYCGCERLQHTIEDWAHIAKSAMYLGQYTIQRITQRILAELERDTEAQKVFEMLVIRNGSMPLTRSAIDDIGLRGNPIWEDLFSRVPVDANARKIITSYSNQQLANL